MSESTARLERRAIRRAIGPELVSFTTDTAQAVQILQAGIQTQAEAHAKLERRFDALVDWATATTNAEPRTFGQRLRWLLTGRL